MTHFKQSDWLEVTWFASLVSSVLKHVMTVMFLSWCELLNDWQSLGLALGLLYPTLERIEEEQRGAIEKCKTKMIAAWLQRHDNVSKNGDPSWAVLKTALINIDENELSDKIMTI